MKKPVVIFCLVLLAVNTAAMATWIELDDGMSHIFNDNSHQQDQIQLDLNIANVIGTHADVLDGGFVDRLSAFNNATINMTGGTVGSANSNGSGLFATDNATISMSGGNVWMLRASSNATVIMSGGTVGYHLGAVLSGDLYLDGTDFQVTDLSGNTTELSYGDKLSNFVPLTVSRNGGQITDYYGGTISGILANGSVLKDVEFTIWNVGFYEGTGDIIIGIVPEPTTLALLTLGGLLVRRRR